MVAYPTWGRHTGNVPVMINGHVNPDQTWLARTRAGVTLTPDLKALGLSENASVVNELSGSNSMLQDDLLHQYSEYLNSEKYA